MTDDDQIQETAPARGKKKTAGATADAAPAPALKPHGQNIGDVVDASQARGGQYEAIGAGKYRRIA